MGESIISMRERLRSRIQFQRTANGVLTVCLTLGDNPCKGQTLFANVPTSYLFQCPFVGRQLFRHVFRAKCNGGKKDTPPMGGIFSNHNGRGVPGNWNPHGNRLL